MTFGARIRTRFRGWIVLLLGGSAMPAMPADGPTSTFVKPPAPRVYTEDEVRTWIRKLGAGHWKERREAETRLSEMPPRYATLLDPHADAGDPEVRHRIRNILTTLRARRGELKRYWRYVLEDRNVRVFKLSALTNGTFRLELVNNGIQDLSLLSDVPLKELVMNNTDVADLSPLAHHPLIAIHLTSTPVRDLAPLASMPLESISFDYLAITNGLNALRDIPSLKSINQIPANTFWNNEPLYRRGIHPATAAAWPGREARLRVIGKHVEDLAPVRNLDPPVQHLAIVDTSITDLRALEGLPLASLTLRNTPVRDLSPLKGMPLTHLVLNRVPIDLLDTVAQLPLTNLTLFGTAVTDLRPLQALKLETLCVNPDTIKQGLNELRSHPTLKHIAPRPGQPYQEAPLFWKTRDH